MRVENIRNVSGAAVASLLLAACTAAGPEPAPDSPSPAPTGQSTSPNREMPYDSCPPSDALGHEYLVEQAKECREIMSDGRVALVGYGLKPKVLKRLAEDTEHQLAGATEDAVTLDITPLAASPEATAALKEVSPACIDTFETYSWSSYTANKLDPALDAYDYVIGATTKPSCSGDEDIEAVKGTTNEGAGGRFIELMFTSNKLPRKNKVTDMEGGVTSPEEQKFDANDLAHELLHAVGLGHANANVHTIDDDRLYNLMSRQRASKRINLIRHMTDGQFREYGNEASIMGDSQPDVTLKSNATGLQIDNVQSAWLAQPDIILGKKPDPFVRLKPKAITAAGGKIYTAKLAKPLQADDFAKGYASRKTEYGAHGEYGTLAIVPTAPDEKRPTVFDLYLLSATNDTLHIDTLYDNAGTTWNLGIGKQEVVMNFEENSTKLSVKNRG